MFVFFSFKVFLSFLTGLWFVFSLIAQPVEALVKTENQKLFDEALIASKNGSSYDALEKWNKVLEIMPNDPISISNRGNVRLTLGDAKGAIDDQNIAIELMPEANDPFLNRGMAKEFLGKWNDAKDDYNFVLDRDPNNSFALYNLGIINVIFEDWNKAEIFFNKASYARKEFPLARTSRALVLYQLGETEDAELEFRSLIRKYPMLADARAGLSALLWRKGLYGEAESNWIAAIGLDSRYKEKEWLLNVRRWPPLPANDLSSLLALKRP